MTPLPGGFADHMSTQFNEPELSDVAIVLDNDDDTKTFHGHRVILATMSDYFRTMLFGPFLEAGMKEIRLPGVPYSLFVDVMRFVYFGWTDLKTVETLDEAVEYYSLCRMLLVDSKMKFFFESWMIRKIETWEKELLRIFGLAFEWDMILLRMECYARIKRTANECLANSFFVELPLEAVRVVLDTSNLNCTRAELEKAIRGWIDHNERETSADVADELIEELTSYTGELCYNYNVLSLYPEEDQRKPEESLALGVCLEPLETLHECLYYSELHILRCITLKGIKICLRANQQFGLQSGRIKSEFDLCLNVKTILRKSSSLETWIESSQRKLTIRYDFTEHDQQSVTIFFPDVNCCKNSNLEFNFSWTGTTVQPLLQNYGPVRGVTAETGSSYVTHIIYQTNGFNERCTECPDTNSECSSVDHTVDDMEDY